MHGGQGRPQLLQLLLRQPLGGQPRQTPVPLQ